MNEESPASFRRGSAKLPGLEYLQARADDPTATPEERATARRLHAQLAKACEIATLWGGDEHAELRIHAFHAAKMAGPGEGGAERVNLGLHLDELCRAVGVPLDGPIDEKAEC